MVKNEHFTQFFIIFSEMVLCREIRVRNSGSSGQLGLGRLNGRGSKQNTFIHILGMRVLPFFVNPSLSLQQLLSSQQNPGVVV